MRGGQDPSVVLVDGATGATYTIPQHLPPTPRHNVRDDPNGSPTGRRRAGQDAPSRLLALPYELRLLIYEHYLHIHLPNENVRYLLHRRARAKSTTIPVLAAVSAHVRADSLPLWASSITFVLFAYKYRSVQHECLTLFRNSILLHICQFCLARVRRGRRWLIPLRRARTAACRQVLGSDCRDSALTIGCDDDDARRAMEDFLRDRRPLYVTSDDFYALGATSTPRFLFPEILALLSTHGVYKSVEHKVQRDLVGFSAEDRGLGSDVVRR